MRIGTACLLFGGLLAAGEETQKLQLPRRNLEQFGCRRPAAWQKQGQNCTSRFVKLGIKNNSQGNSILQDSTMVKIQAKAEPLFKPLGSGRTFTKGSTGYVIGSRAKHQGLSVYIDGPIGLQPPTDYQVFVETKTKKGLRLSDAKGQTGKAGGRHAVDFSVKFGKSANLWPGRFLYRILQPELLPPASNERRSYKLIT